MGYRLTITAGLGEGKSFTFDQAETRIGRTAENDVVLFDPGVSRTHARIVEKNGEYLLEDLESANGTRLNGVAIKAPTALKTGDRIVLGPVAFTFELEGPLEPEIAGAETRIVDRATIVPSARTASEGLAAVHSPTPGPTDPKPIEQLARHDPGQPRAAADLAQIGEDADRGEAGADLDLAADASSPRPRSPSEEDRVGRRGSVERPALSAAERARLKREAGKTLGGQLRYAWLEMSARSRALALGAAGLLVLLAVGGLGGWFMPDGGGAGPSGPEPDKLSLTPITDSFGLGAGVTWTRPDMKVFEFELTAPTRAVVVLHYQAQDISEKEVSVIVNAVDQGWVPPDVSGAPDREIEQVLSPKSLKRNEKNQLIFDNVKNPPGKEPWRIRGLWIEVVPIPELSPAETIAMAQEYATNAGRFYDQREVASENLFRAWKSYRDAWLALESLDSRPEPYETVRFQMNSIKRELDQLCSRLMLDVERSVQLKNPRRARQTLEDVPRYFPTREHRCHNLALKKMAEYDL